MTESENTNAGHQQGPGSAELTGALKAAGSAHHEYEQAALHGVFDEQWPMFYAAYVLGRLGDFTKPSLLAQWLKDVPSDESWASTAADYVVGGLAE